MKVAVVYFIAITFFHALYCSDLIEQIMVRKNRLEVTVNKEFKHAYLHEDFFVEYDEDIDLEKLDYSLVTLPFIMNVISLVWASGKDYYIDSMDHEVYDSLERIKKIFKVFYPETSWNGRLIPREIVKNDPLTRNEDSERIALLFSGGVDSTSSSFAHRAKQQLLITAWGQSCLPLNDPSFWYKMKKYLTFYAECYGHTNAFIKSNYYYFLKLKKLSRLSPEIATWRIDTIEDIGWAGLIAPILITHGISKLYIGSSETWNCPYPSAANPYIDGNISFAGIRIKHDQFDFSRYDKIGCIVDLCRHHFVTRPTLIVCQKQGGVINCGNCEKCLLTSLSLSALNEDPKDYGFSLTMEQAEDNTKNLVKSGRLSSNGIWQFTDLQEKIKEKHITAFDWLLDIHFDELKPYDIKNAKKVDWAILQQMFPHIKLKKSKKNMQKLCIEESAQMLPLDSGV